MTPQSSTPDERQATLKMLTAKYCDAVSYTRNGTFLLWQSLTGWTEGVIPPTVNDGPMEAKWTAKGAACLSHSRAWTDPLGPVPSFDGVKVPFNSEAELVNHVRSACNIPSCEGFEPGDDTVYWITTTVDHASDEP